MIKVEHAIGILCDGAWKTCESISFFKVLFLSEIKSNSFEIEIILFFKESFTFKTKSSFEVKDSFFFKTFSQSFLFFKILFSFKTSSGWVFKESHSFEISIFSCEAISSLEDKFLFSSLNQNYPFSKVYILKSNFHNF